MCERLALPWFVVLQNRKFVNCAFSDANWASYLKDKRSTSAFYILMSDNLISWYCIKHKVLSYASTILEYGALSSIASELLWIKSLLKELMVPIPRNPVIYCDNLSAKALAQSPLYHTSTK